MSEKPFDPLKWGPLGNPNIHRLTDDEKLFLGAIKDGPKTTRELVSVDHIEADQAQNVARQFCKRHNLAEYHNSYGEGGEKHRWRITKEGQRALAWGYIKPPLPNKRAPRAPNGTKAAKKRGLIKTEE